MKKQLITTFILSICISSTAFAQDYHATNDSFAGSPQTKELCQNSTLQEVEQIDGLYQFPFTTNEMTDEMKEIAANSIAPLQEKGTGSPQASPTDVKAQSTIILATEDEKQAEEWIDLLASTDDSVTERVWDDTYGVQGILTVYYIEGNLIPGLDDVDCVLLTEMEGDVNVSDSAIQILMNRDNRLAYGCNDAHNDTYGQYDDVRIYEIPFTESIPNDWYPADIGQSVVRAVGAVWEIPLRRGSTEWMLTVENVLYGDITI